MTARPRLLDLFCGAGGAAVGYHRAGFDVVGVDIKPQPRYPFEFHQADALSILRGMAYWPSFNGELWRPSHWAAIHASPPCQAYSSAAAWQRGRGRRYLDLIAATRGALQSLALPWVIENVPGAPIRADYRLCGCLFGLDELRRERWFETSWFGYELRSPCYHTALAITICGHGTPSRSVQRLRGLPNPGVKDQRRAMDIDWMTRDELAQAIPPAYTKLIGEALLAHLKAVAA